MNEAPTQKSYYSISEVSADTQVKAHVLRYWETQFSMLRPRKSRGGIRQYRPQDVALVGQIKHLLYNRGFTIAGARRALKDGWRGGQMVSDAPEPEPSPRTAAIRSGSPQGEFSLGRPLPVGRLAEIRQELTQLRRLMARPVDPPADSG